MREKEQEELRCSILVVSHNHREHVELLVESLNCVSIPYQLGIVDNTGLDGTAEWIKQTRPDAYCVKNAVPRGFSENVNHLIQNMKVLPYVLVVNPDVVIKEGCVETLIDFLDTFEDVGIAAPRLLNEDGTRQFSARAFSRPRDLVIRGLHLDGLPILSKFVSSYLLPDLPTSGPVCVDWVTGAFMAIRRRHLDEVGVFDERYFLYSEDQDLCCRFWRHGRKVMYVPAAEAYHVHLREGMSRPLSKAARWQLQSAILMFAKFGWRLSRRGSV